VQSSSVRPLAAVLIVLVAVVGCGNAQSAPSDRGAIAATNPGEVVAVINGEPITAADLDDTIAASLAKLDEQAYQLKKTRLDEMIADRLLAAEARRRNISVPQLIDQEVTRKVSQVTNADVAQFVAANRSRIQGDPARLDGRIRAFLAEQRTSARRDAFVDALRRAASIDVRLKAPPVFRAPVKTDGFPSRGPASAPVTIVEFSDFHCPFCRAAQPTLQQVLARYPDQVRLVYRHFPLDSIHPEARRAAEASWCAARQDKFWRFHDGLYANGADASTATLDRVAREAGLDTAAFDACLAGGDARAAVQRDVDEGLRFGVDGTPGFFINGRMLSGNQPMDAFVKIVDEELKGTR
jgi:protein-disulfide isomerase